MVNRNENKCNKRGTNAFTMNTTNATETCFQTVILKSKTRL